MAIYSKSKKNKTRSRKISKSEKNWLERLKSQAGKIKTLEEFLKTIVMKDIK